MRYLNTKLILMSVALMLSATVSFALPNCPSDQTKRYHNCFGTYSDASGDKYVGEFKDDKRNGQGTYTYASGSKYVGEHKDDKRNGQGTYTYANGDKYVGEYKDDKKDGQGTYTFADGGKYVGEWKDDKQHGQGTYTFGPNTEWAGDKYAGEFKDDKRNGQGTYTYASGDKYVGEYKDNKTNGQGTYTYANGDKYVGEFKDDKTNGQGTYTYASGDDYIGGWKDNRKDGQGTYTYADGTVEQGIWKDGVSQSEAVRLWKLDAEKGNPKAQYNLAEAYELGNGVTKNNVLAHMWYNLSLTNDFKLGLTRKNELEQKMKPNEIGQAEAYAELCRNKDYKFCHDENNTFFLSIVFFTIGLMIILSCLWIGRRRKRFIADGEKVQAKIIKVERRIIFNPGTSRPTYAFTLADGTYVIKSLGYFTLQHQFEKFPIGREDEIIYNRKSGVIVRIARSNTQLSLWLLWSTSLLGLSFIIWGFCIYLYF